jgi:molecular chaperone GrpE
MTTNNSELQTEQPDVGHEPSARQSVADEDGETEQRPITAEEAPAARNDLERANEDRADFRDRLARLQAEFENSRKRAARELQEFKDLALADALKSMLPVLDSFDRALQAPAETVDGFRFGIQLIRKEFKDTLVKLGLSQIAAKGKTFDPRVHEALDIVDTSTAADNQVLEELQHGYKLGERLLRPAMVRVAHNPEHGSEPQARVKE